MLKVLGILFCALYWNTEYYQLHLNTISQFKTCFRKMNLFKQENLFKLDRPVDMIHLKGIKKKHYDFLMLTQWT